MSSVQYVVVVRDRPNHLLHLILTLLTAGLWIPVWLILTMRSRFKRMNPSKPSSGFRLVVGILAIGVVCALLL